MSTTTTTASELVGESTGNWKAGVVGGIAGAAVMGAFVLVMSPPTLAVAIPSLYALAPPPSPGLGLVVHLSHGAVLGVVFAALVRGFDLDSTGSIDSTATLLGLGLAWGVVTWVVLAALLMPLWLSAVGSPANPPFPNFALPSLLWHLVYGLVLAGVYVVTENRL